MGSPGPSPEVTPADALEVFSTLDQPSTPLTASEVAEELNCTRRTAHRKLERLAEDGRLETKKPGAHSRVWWRPRDVRRDGSSAGASDEDTETGQSAREEFRDFVDAVEDYAIFTLDPDGTVATWNEGAQRIKGYDEEAILGEHFSTFYVEADRDAGVPERNLTTAAQEGRVEDEGWRLRSDGTRFWANVVITAIRNDDGELQGFTKVTRDMSERHEYELRLKRQRNRTQEILDAAPSPIAILDGDGDVVQANERAEEVLGVSEEELIDGPVRAEEWTLYGSDGEELGPTDVPSAHVRESGQPITDVEVAIEDPSGERTWLSVNAAPFSDPDGSNERVVMAGEDITHLKERQQELEAELTEILGRVSDAFYALDDEWRFTHVNEEAAEILGHSPEDLLGETVWEVFPNSTDGIFWEQFHEAMETQQPVSFENYGEDIDAWLEFTAYPSESGLSIYFQDVTERKERERELAKYETIVETMDDGIYVKDRDGYFTMVNEAYAEMTGYAPEELVGAHASLVVDESTIQESREVIADETSGPTMEAMIQRADGDTVPAEGTFATLDTGEEVGVVRDITDRKRRERELERYETIVETVDDGVYIVDEDGYFTMVNDAYAEMTGYDREELLGEHVTLVVDEETAETAQAREERLRAGENDGSPYQADLIRKDGERFPAEATFGLLTGSDGDTHRVGVVRDVTERVERERALAESERRYRTLVDNFPDGAVGLFDRSLTYTAFGGELFEEIDDVDPEDRIGHHVEDVYPPELLEDVKPYLDATLEGEANTFDVEYYGRHLRVRTHPVGEGDDEVYGGMLLVQDVTERREHERRLEESERRYRTLIDNFQNGAVALVDGDLRYQTVGGDIMDDDVEGPEALEGKRVADAVAPDLADVIEPKYRAALSGESSSFEYEYDGTISQVDIFPVRDEDGDVFAAMGMSQDITDHVERERALERALDLLEKMEQVADVGGWEIDPATEDVFWSDHLFDILGRESQEEPPVDEAFDVYHEVDRQIVEDAIENAIANATDFDVEVRFFTGSGELRWLRVQGDPEIEDGEVVTLRGAAQDVTERVERERRLEELIDKLEESNERLERFAYVASHDLQEPLRMISNYLQLLERRYRDELDEDAGEFIDYAVDGAERMREMISDLLAYSRLDTGAEPFEPVDAEEAVDNVLEDLQFRIEETAADVAVGDLPTVEADRNQFEMVFQNLLSNAIKYSGEEPPDVDVSAERRDEEWVFHVEDDGIGMDPDYADDVFDVFNRLHTHEEYPGTGIGLAMCKKIVDRHDGDIWVDSEPGEGSTFSFTVPVEGPDDGGVIDRETNGLPDAEVGQ